MKKQQLGMLNPYAAVYIPETERKRSEKNGKEGRTHVETNSHSESKPDNKVIEETRTVKSNNEQIYHFTENQAIETKTDIIDQYMTNHDFGWKIVRKRETRKPSKKATQKTWTSINRYESLIQDVDKDDTLLRKNLVVETIVKDIKLKEAKDELTSMKTTTKYMKEQYEIESMTVKALEEAIKSMCSEYNDNADLGQDADTIHYSQVNKEAAEEKKGHIIPELMEYLWMSEIKAQKGQYSKLVAKFNKSIKEHNSFREEAVDNAQVIIDAYHNAIKRYQEIAKMHNDLEDEYNELLGKHREDVKMYDELVDAYNDLLARHQNELNRSRDRCRSPVGYNRL